MMQWRCVAPLLLQLGSKSKTASPLCICQNMGPQQHLCLWFFLAPQKKINIKKKNSTPKGYPPKTPTRSKNPLTPGLSSSQMPAGAAIPGGSEHVPQERGDTNGGSRIPSIEEPTGRVKGLKKAGTQALKNKNELEG